MLSFSNSVLRRRESRVYQSDTGVALTITLELFPVPQGTGNG